jgi:SAM-dependent methyltransferase
MNPTLQQLFAKFYTRNLGASPTDYYARNYKMLALFKKHNISSVFDSGCRDRDWIRLIDFKKENIEYIGADISPSMVEYCRQNFTNYEFLEHGCTTDQLPEVDLILSSDVMIHLNNQEKLKFLNNFVNSNSKYLLMTDDWQCYQNTELEFTANGFPFANINWALTPWNFPPALDFINDDIYNNQRLKLWSHAQIEQAVSKIEL